MAESDNNSNNTQPPQGAAADANSGQQFSIQRIYLKDVSFETPMSLDAFGKQWKPHINQEVGSKNSKVDEDVYEVVLTLTVTGKLEDKNAFLVEIHQAGLFMAKGFDNQQLGHVLNSACLQILFPYAREAVDSLLSKGSFPPLMLPPLNFDALYVHALQQAMQQAKEKQESGSGAVN